MELIEIKNLNKIFQTSDVETRALNEINLTVKKGEFVSVTGPSGCGKSTLLNVIGLLDAPTSGTMIIDGVSAEGMSDNIAAKLRNQKLGFIFQSFHLIPALTIRDNVELPLLYRKNISAAECRKRTEEVIEKVGLTHRINHYPSQLSGGQCQRVAIARAIVGKPEILLADEPTGNLDSKMGTEIIELLKQLNKEGTTIVMITHDPTIAQQTTRQIVMKDGRIVD